MQQDRLTRNLAYPSEGNADYDSNMRMTWLHSDAEKLLVLPDTDSDVLSFLY